jgi:hypothetical protein
LFIEGAVFTVDIMRAVRANVDQAVVETVIQGPNLAFTEDIQTNINCL